MYSYGVVLWVLSFEKAYWDMTLEEHLATVIISVDEHPKVGCKWSVLIQTLLQVIARVLP